MAAEVSLFTIGIPGLGVILILLLILVLIQCGDAKKDRNSRDIESTQTDGPYEKVAYIISCEQTKDGPEPSNHNDDDKKSSTLKSNASGSLEISDRPKQPTPSLQRHSKDYESTDLVRQDKKLRDDILGGPVGNEVANAKGASLPRDSRNGSGSPKDVPKVPEGNPETSWSGEELYTRVKPAEVKPECAYSVVDIADKDTKYEMIDGKLVRTNTTKKEVTENFAKSVYETFDVKKPPELDPVLYAVEDSGASGIYEDVGESKEKKPVSVPGQLKVANTIEKEKVTEAEETAHDEPKKKWGLTRFSLIKRNKGKGNKEKHDADSPTERRKSNFKGSNEKLSKADTGGKKQQESGSHRRSASGHEEQLPPPPPIENLRLKVEKRRTYHEGDSVIALSSDENVVKRPPTSTQNFNQNDNNDGVIEDALYEIPDRDIAVHKMSPTRETAPKWRSGSASSPLMANRQIPKPPQLEVVTSFPDSSADFEDENYESIPVEKKDGSLERTGTSTYPGYAKVKKMVSANAAVKDVGGETTESNVALPTEKSQKIEVLMRRTTISTNAKQTVNADNSDKSSAVVDVSYGPGEAPIQPQDDEPDVNVKPVNIEDLYANVDMAKKRDEEAKRALYATVNKERTGVKKYYYGNEVLEMQNEYEGDHYTKIEEMDDSSTSTECGASDEQKNMAMFQAIRPASKGKSQVPTVASDYETVEERGVIKQPIPNSSSEYETIASSIPPKTYGKGDEYEEIENFPTKAWTKHQNETGKQKRIYKRNEDEYLDINSFPDSSKEENTSASTALDVHL